MAATKNKHSASRAQGSRRRAHASTKTQAATKRRTKAHTSAKQRPKAKRARLPPSLRYKEIKLGKTTIRHYDWRSSYRLEEFQGKPVECVEFYTAGENHTINIRFLDKTALHLTIDPGFILQPSYFDCKTGDGRCIKRWPVIRSAGFRT